MQLPKPRMPVPRSPDLAEPAAPICPAATRDPQPAPTSLAPTVLLYDWDNTLVDGWAAITAALNAVFAEFGMPAWTRRGHRRPRQGRPARELPPDVRRPLGTCPRPVLRQLPRPPPGPPPAHARRGGRPGGWRRLAAGRRFQQGRPLSAGGGRPSGLGGPFPHRGGGRRRRRRQARPGADPSRPATASVRSPTQRCGTWAIPRSTCRPPGPPG